MGSFRGTYYSGSRCTEGVEFIQCVDGRENNIYKICCLGLDSVTREVHTPAQVEVASGTVVQFSTNYLSEHGRRIPSSANFPSTEVSNFWLSPISSEPVYPCLLSISKLPLSPQAGNTVVPTIRTGGFSQGDLK